MADLTRQEMTRANYMRQYWDDSGEIPSIKEIDLHMDSINPDAYDTKLNFDPNDQFYQHLYLIKSAPEEKEANDVSQRPSGFAGNFAAREGILPTSEPYKEEEFDEDDILKSEEPEYMGVTKRQWELLGGMGAGAAREGIAALVGGGKKAVHGLMDWVEKGQRKEEMKNRHEYDLAQAEKEGKKAGTQQFKDMQADAQAGLINRRSKEAIRVHQLERKRAAEEEAKTKALIKGYGFDPRNPLPLLKPPLPRGTRDYESIHSPSIENYIKKQEPEQTSALDVAAKQSLHNKIKDKWGRFITHNREKGEAMDVARQQKSIHRQGLIDNEDALKPEMMPGYDPWSDAKGYPELQTGYDSETGLNKLTKEYWEKDQKEFKDLGGQYRILDPTNKYKDVQANPDGNRDQKMKAWLMRKATRRMTDKKWYQKQDYKYDWK